MTDQQTAATDNALETQAAMEAYEEWIIRVPGEFTLPHISEAFVRGYLAALHSPEAAERIKSLLAEVDAAVERERQQTGLINKYGLRITELLADRQRMRDALELAQGWLGEIGVPMEVHLAVSAALNPVSKETNDGDR